MTPIFVDTGAWFARFVPSDPDHPAARESFEENTDPLITTDYIIDELLTVLKVRGEFQRALEVGPSIFNGDVCNLEWVSQADVANGWRVFSPIATRAGASPIALAEWSWNGFASRRQWRSMSISASSGRSALFHEKSIAWNERGQV